MKTIRNKHGDFTMNCGDLIWSSGSNYKRIELTKTQREVLEDLFDFIGRYSIINEEFVCACGGALDSDEEQRRQICKKCFQPVTPT